MGEVKKIIEQARDYYFNKWRGNEKICPAFKEKVYITNLGWNHIVKHPRRLLVDKIIRLKKLPLARDVLETATTYQTCEKRGKYYLYGFRAIKDDTVIKVVVSSRTKTSKKSLFSVMFKNIDRNEQRKIIQHNEKIISAFRKNNPKVFPKKRRP